jgi:uncharacterized protein
MKKTILTRQILRIGCALVAVVLLSLPVLPARAGSGHGESTAGHIPETSWSSPLILFQRVISRADGDRCPMAPSCSHYAAEVFEHYHPVTAWILTCDRLLRCGHDEIRLAPRVRVDGQTRAYDPVSANTSWWGRP